MRSCLCAHCCTGDRASRRTVQVVFEKAIYLVRLRRHRQARRYTLRIDAASRQVVLTMPPRGSLKEAKEFAQKHGAWIACAAQAAAGGGAVCARRRSAAARKPAPHSPSAWGARHGVDRAKTVTAMACFASPANHLMSTAGSTISSSARRCAISRRRAAAMPTCSACRIKRVAVRDQTSRWGSCSRHRRVVVLLAARSGAALRARLSRRARGRTSDRLNHSPRFWRMVETSIPNVERAKVWLEVHGADLHRFGLPAARTAGDI